MKAEKLPHHDRYPDLAKSYKAFFPFKLATTSFIYPADYIPNVVKLARFVDEIELLFFESAPADRLPNRAIIDQLARFSEEFKLSYNVHLPIDIDPACSDRTVRRQAVETIGRIIEACAALVPTSYTLHVPMQAQDPDRQALKRWETAVQSSISDLLAGGLDGKLLAVETLTYPFQWIEPIIEDFDLSVCIDFGHLALSGQDLEDVFRRNFHRAAVIHLHGFDGNHDHLPLDRLDADLLEKILTWIKPFSRTVSLEVFSYADLMSSLDILEKTWKEVERIGAAF